MVRLKTVEEIEQLKRGGALLASILQEVIGAVAPGVTTRELDQLARRLIAQAKVQPSFLGYSTRRDESGFPAALCVSVNAAVVHGLPSDLALREGDIVGLDLGIVYEGLYLDHARTVPVGKVSASVQKLLQVTREALERGIAAAQPGNRLGDIGAAVEEYVEGEGLGVVRQLVGHGVGYAVHEAPKVPNFGHRGRGEKINPGLVIAIEPMVIAGDPTVRTAADGWTVVTADGSLAAHEEHTVAVTAEGPRVLTVVS